MGSSTATGQWVLQHPLLVMVTSGEIHPATSLPHCLTSRTDTYESTIKKYFSNNLGQELTKQAAIKERGAVPESQATPTLGSLWLLHPASKEAAGHFGLPPGTLASRYLGLCLGLFLPPQHPMGSLHAMHPNVSQGCQGGCATCSDYNGCLSCKPRLFFVLERIGMKQIGVCLSSCPSGYYGTRYPDINKCAKCKADCETCFTRNFCTKCKSGFYLYSGKCLEKCPDGLEANNHTMECTSIVHCEASEWSPWSPCTKKGKTCGFKRGNEIRVREIVQHPSARGNPCPATSESRKCVVQRKRCQKEGKAKYSLGGAR
ncbi:R-spondin-3 isoform X1 [Aix galericulata]|nr:R-spondin-3 isoform X1 [Aix galericulata]